MVEASINAMPRKGRSARAGAVLFADFSSSNGNGILFSLAAGGGSKLENYSNRASAPQKQYLVFYDKALNQEADMR
jgi:hypothetical protein